MWGLLVQGAFAQELPGLGAGLHRQTIDVDQSPFRILARVQTGLGTKCTGFAVAPTIVETAAHCLWSARTEHFIQPWDIHVLQGYHMGQYRTHATAIRVIIPMEYDPHDEARTAAADRAILVLDRAVVAQTDLLPFVQAMPGMAAAIAGYEQDRLEVAAGDLNCRVLALEKTPLNHTPLAIAHDCSATHGASGAPLLVRENAGGWAIAGMAVLARPDRGGLAAGIPDMR